MIVSYAPKHNHFLWFDIRAPSAYRLSMPRLTRIKHESFTRKVVAGIAQPEKGITPAKAYQQVYGVSDRSAQVSSSTLLARPDIRARISETLESAFPPGVLSTHLNKLMKATRPIVHEGAVTSHVPDNVTRLETARTILRVLGAYRTGETATQDNRTVNFYLSSEQVAGLSETVERLERLGKELTRRPPKYES